MMQRWYGSFIIAGVMIFASCAGRNKLEKMRLDCTERVTKAIEQYNNGKFSLAQVKLEDARTQCSGSPIMDTVLYYLGMADAGTKKYMEARTEFQRLVQDYPGSPFFDEAKFRIGYVVYRQSHPANRDQKETREAIRLLDNFIEMYPKSAFIDSAVACRTEAYEKLASKEFKNAQFYEKINEPEAAVVYYRAFLKQYVDSKLADRARFNTIELLLKLDRVTEAVEMKDELLSVGKDKELKKEVKKLFSGRKKASGSGDG